MGERFDPNEFEEYKRVLDSGPVVEPLSPTEKPESFLKRASSAALKTVQQPPVEKGMLRKIAESVVDSPALPIAGGVVGGIAGAPTGPGAIGTAALGGAAGESYRQLAARSLGMDSPGTSTEAAKEIGISGIEQGIGEGVGLGLGRVARGAAKLPIIKPAIEGVKKTAGDIFQLVTKIKPKDAETLFKNPKALLPGEWKKAQETWRKAAKEAGIEVDDVSPEMLEILKGDGRSKVFDTYSKLVSGENVTAKEAQIAKQALDSVVMPTAKTIRKNPQIKTLEKIRAAFSERIGKESPALAKANKDYAIASSGKKFRSLFPRNLDDRPAYFRSSVLPGFLTAAGAYRGDPLEGALQGAGVAALSSPLAIGSLLAAIGSSRGIQPRRLFTASLANLIGERFKGDKDVSSKR